MDRKKSRFTLDIEFFGCIVGIALILFAMAAFLDMEKASGFLVFVSGFGILLNAVLAGLKYLTGRHVSAVIFAVAALLLTVLFVIQLLAVL